MNNMLERLLRSKAETAVLGVVLFTDGLHLREIARRAKTSAPQAKAELDSLCELGILKMEKKGNLSIYSSNPVCPFIGELRSLYLKTDGAIGILSWEISKLRGAALAFVYGSFANGNYSEKSDMDVLVVGNLRAEDLDAACFLAQKKSGREINYILWSEGDLKRKAKESGAFYSSIVKGKKIWLAGGEDELERFASQ
jgi:predicted nucleotidyltransferase